MWYSIRLLEQGDRLTRDEFERRYQRMRRLRKAELIEGTVFMPSPVRATKHAEPHNFLETPGFRCFDNSTVRLDLDNEPQPDLVLIKAKGGQTRISQDDYIEGAPEMAVEIVGSSAAYDLDKDKLSSAPAWTWSERGGTAPAPTGPVAK